MENSLKKHFQRSFSLMIACCIGTASSLLFVLPVYAQKAERPNIVLVLVDDLGFSDTGPYGALDLETPNLDKLAGEGIRLKEFYNNSICAPTRASLLTGQYQHKAGMGYFNVNLGLPAYQGFLNKESLTLAEVLRSGGYSTLMSGKWHVGDDKDQWPNQRGFDQFFGFIGGASNYYELEAKEKAQVPLMLNNEPFYLEPGKYLTDEITGHALDFLTAQNQTKKPFFLYLAYNAPHWPLQALPEDIAKYKGRYKLGWDSLRTIRFKNAVEKGLIDPGQKIAVADKLLKPWNKLTYDEQQYWQLRQEVYAAMIDHVDQGIGKLLEKLKELKKDKNTLIVFISDNGSQGGNGLRLYTQRTTGPVGSAGSYEVQNSNWSQTGNSPLRSYKDSPYEGGISAPFIAWYPGKINANTIAQGTAHLIDLAPTFYQLAGITYPAQFQNTKTNALAGKSLVPLLTGQVNRVDRAEPLFWERSGKKAVRDGKWKLVSLAGADAKYELYDLEADRAENTDLAAQYPEVVERLKSAYTVWASKNDVVDYEKLRPLPAAGVQPGSRRTN
ncbi:arylsulfatase [Pedobacter metabolipauper]|uniref:Arylsulfatase n=1 Tax=Pedobacter metabolipauper TaxID=425513 RepID=A0A4R6SQ27_9SPHI|nr:arylsulfatase [Pedobacter metabolipauper]TDQ06324.1 arylsulfatase [Pedobacter metabolipauper]